LAVEFTNIDKNYLNIHIGESLNSIYSIFIFNKLGIFESVNFNKVAIE